MGVLLPPALPGALEDLLSLSTLSNSSSSSSSSSSSIHLTPSRAMARAIANMATARARARTSPNLHHTLTIPVQTTLTPDRRLHTSTMASCSTSSTNSSTTHTTSPPPPRTLVSCLVSPSAATTPSHPILSSTSSPVHTHPSHYSHYLVTPRHDLLPLTSPVMSSPPLLTHIMQAASRVPTPRRPSPSP